MDNDSNTPFSNACSNSSLLLSSPEVTHYTNTNINTVAMTTSISTNGTKVAEFLTDEDHMKIDSNMQLSETPDIDLDDVSVIVPSHTNISHSTKPSQRQIDIMTFGKGKKGHLNNRAVYVEQCIPYTKINDIISGKTPHPYLNNIQSEARMMDEEEISNQQEHFTLKIMPTSKNFLLVIHHTVMIQCMDLTRIQQWRDGFL